MQNIPSNLYGGYFEMCIGYWHHELRGKGVASGKVILMERSENINSPFISGLRENVNTLRMQSRRKKKLPPFTNNNNTPHSEPFYTFRVHFRRIFVAQGGTNSR